MNFLSINIKGLGVAAKADWIREIQIKEGISFLAVQETLAIELDNKQVSRYWDNSVFGMDFVGATGRSGGLLCMWDVSKLKVSEVVKDRNFLLVKGELVGREDIVCILNV